jgi:hypothetical protein
MRLLGQMFSMAMATVVLALIIGRQAITPENYDLFLRSIRTGVFHVGHPLPHRRVFLLEPRLPARIGFVDERVKIPAARQKKKAPFLKSGNAGVVALNSVPAFPADACQGELNLFLQTAANRSTGRLGM